MPELKLEKVLKSRKELKLRVCNLSDKFWDALEEFYGGQLDPEEVIVTFVEWSDGTKEII